MPPAYPKRGRTSAALHSLAVTKPMSSPIEQLPFGVVVLRGFLQPDAQLALVKAVLASVNLGAKTAELRDPGKRYSQLAMWNWPDRYGGMIADDACTERPELILSTAQKVVETYHAAGCSSRVSCDRDAGSITPVFMLIPPPQDDCEKVLQLPESFSPTSLRVIGYGAGGLLPEHTDMYMVRCRSHAARWLSSWIVSCDG